MRGRFGSRPYIQNVNATVAEAIAMPTKPTMESHMMTVTQVGRLRGGFPPVAAFPGERIGPRLPGAACELSLRAHIFNVAPGCIPTDVCNLDTGSKRACPQIIPALRLDCHTLCV